MIWFVLFVCFCIGWVQQTARKEASRGRYHKPPAAPPKASQTHAPQPRKIILPDALTPEELAEFGPGWLS